MRRRDYSPFSLLLNPVLLSVALSEKYVKILLEECVYVVFTDEFFYLPSKHVLINKTTLIKYFRNWRDSIGVKTFALHRADPALITGLAYWSSKHPQE